MAASNSRQGRTDGPVVVSGYYGFGNLGDEAILEELLAELSQLGLGDDTIVLSARPEITEQTFSVRAVDRWNLAATARALAGARLLVSGGGGLFQDTGSAGSCLYYGGQIALARLLGVPAVAWAQGIGPVSGAAARAATRLALGLCSAVAVRDSRSAELLQSWGIGCLTTADPVWRLEATPAEDSLLGPLLALRQRLPAPKAMVGVSLRQSASFSSAHLECLCRALQAALPPGSALVLLPLQSEQDRPLLDELARRWAETGGAVHWLAADLVRRPSQWLPVFKELDFLVAMRLHALIMALKEGVAVAGLPYDPKVQSLLAEFEQPILNLANHGQEGSWAAVIGEAYSGRKDLAARARSHAESAKNLACQNFSLLAKILGMQSDPRSGS